MQCPHCQSALGYITKFCPQCGKRIGRTCPFCDAAIAVESHFCGECGAKLDTGASMDSDRSQPPPLVDEPQPVLQRGERRHLTVLFSDLSDYTGLSERCDPEDVKQLLIAVMDTAQSIIHAYGGHVERIIGDGVLAIFGLPTVHEDDAIRAIKVTRELHQAIKQIRLPQLSREKLPVTMHSGINTGLVVTDYAKPIEGRYGISGDTVNLAARLAQMAGADEILVGSETYKQAHGFFGFRRKLVDHIKGKTGDIRLYSVLHAKERPVSIRRSHGLRADLVGRNAELVELHQAIARLRKKQGTIFTLIGDAGTGKSRLLYEFESAYKTSNFQWLTGYAYAHTQSIAYFPLIDLLRRWLKINDTHTVAQVRTLIREGVVHLLGDAVEEIPLLESLYGLENDAVKGMSPEIWRDRLTTTISRILSAIARQQPTIICLEDLHWADMPTIEMLRRIVNGFRYPCILICSVRPPFSLFPGQQLELPAPICREIRLGELSFSEARDLVESLLSAGTIPMHLLHVISDRAEGNPFFLEELINSLVDSAVLIYDNRTWRLARDFTESDIPSNIHGVITARLDRLGRKARNLLQEAAVIGRAFLYEVLEGISVYGSQLDAILLELEHSGMIHLRSAHPEREYMFKHALIQEVCYSNLLRSERQQVHERIGRYMETLFADRLNEFYETLALHYKNGLSYDKAAEYLLKSGRKALRRYALDESHRTFLAAMQLVEARTPPTPESQAMLVDVLNQWAFVYYYRGRFRDLQKLFDGYQPVVDALSDPARQGMYWAWRGWILWHRGHFEAAYQMTRKARELGKASDNAYVIGHACNWMAWIGADTGRLDEAVELADEAIALYEKGRTDDQYVYFNALAGKGYAHWHRGDRGITHGIGTRLIDFGRRHTNMRSLVLGHSCHGWSYLIAGDMARATTCFERAVQVSADPWYARFPKLAHGYGLAAEGNVEAADPILRELIEFSTANGAEFLGTTARFFQELIHINRAEPAEGLLFMEAQLETWRRTASWLRYAICCHILAHTYARLSLDAGTDDPDHPLGGIERIRNKAEQWYRTCIETALSGNMRMLQAQSWLGLAELFHSAGRGDDTRDALERSISLLDACDAEVYLARARALSAALQQSG
jgi:class 3 adenylate cyclase/tetratricopeptide (TPR) repeat protein